MVRARRPWRRAATKIVLGVAGLVGLLFAAVHLPPVQTTVGAAALRTVAAGLGAGVDAGSIRWNLLSGTLEARDVAIRGVGERAATALSLARLEADVSTTALLRGRIVVERLVVERPVVRLAVEPDGRLLLPFVVSASKGEPTTRPGVELRELRLSGGALELTDRGEAAWRIDVTGVDLRGSARLRDLFSTGELSLGSIAVSSTGREPLRGSTLTARWETKGGIASLKAHLVAREPGLEARLEASARELAGTPRFEATVTASGTLGPLAARLAPRLGLGGRFEARVVAEGSGAELASATATLRGEAVELLGRAFDRVALRARMAGGALREGTLDVTAGRGRITLASSGTLLPAPKDLRFALRAERVELARLLALQPGGARVTGTLDGTFEGTLARPALEGLAATADLRASGVSRSARGSVAPAIRARIGAAGGVITVESAELAERRTTATLRGRYDHARRAFEGSVDVESADVGPYLALLGVEGRGELSAHVRGGGTLTRPVLDGTLRARALVAGGVRVDRVELDARAQGAQVVLSNGSFAAHDVSARAEGEGTLPLAGVASPALDLRVRGIAFRGHAIPDVTVHAALGREPEVRIATADGSLSAQASFPPAGGFRIGATFRRFGLSALPGRPRALDAELSGRFEASRDGAGPLGASTLDARLRLDVPDVGVFAALLAPKPEGVPAPFGGSLWADVTLGGSLARPVASGTVRALDLAAFGITLTRLDAELKPAEDGLVAARVALAGLAHGAYRLDEAHLEASLRETEVRAEGDAVGGRLRLKGTGSLSGSRPFEATAAFEALDVTPYLRAAGGPPEVVASVSGRVHARGTLADLGRAAMEVELDSLEATHPRWSVRAAEPVGVVVSGGGLEVRALRLAGNGISVEAAGRLPFDGTGGSLSVTSTVDLGILPGLFEAFDRASGRVAGHVDIAGSVARPLATGSVTFVDALVDGPELPMPIERLTGTVTLRPDEVRTESLSARVGGGTVTLSGVTGLSGREPPRVDATLRARDVELEAGKDVQVRAGADLRASGDWPALAVQGEVRLDDLVYVPELDVLGLMKTLAARLRRVAVARQEGKPPFGSGVSLDVAVLAKDAIHVEGTLGEAELGGNLRVEGTVERPVVLGTISSNRGVLHLFGSTFDLSRCRLDFSDPLAIDPDVDLVATTTKGDEEITVRIDGRASKAQLLLSSSRGRSQAEIVNSLFGGSGGAGDLRSAAARMAMRGAATPLLGTLGAEADLEIVPLPTTPEGEEFLFSVGKDLGGGIDATYFKGVSGETKDAFELKWRLGSRTRGRLRQNQDGSLSGGFRIRRELD